MTLDWPWVPLPRPTALPAGYRNCRNGSCDKMIPPTKSYAYCSDCRRDSERRFGPHPPSQRGTRNDLSARATAK